MFASHPSRTTVPLAPAALRLAPIWRKEPSKAPAAHCANWPLLLDGSSGRLTTRSGACAASRCILPDLVTMAGKLSWPTKVVRASSARPRSWARQGKPPPVAPERQPRPETLGVLTSAAEAAVPARAVEAARASRPARQRARGRLVGIPGLLVGSGVRAGPCRPAAGTTSLNFGLITLTYFHLQGDNAPATLPRPGGRWSRSSDPVLRKTDLVLVEIVPERALAPVRDWTAAFALAWADQRHRLQVVVPAACRAEAEARAWRAMADHLH